MNRDERQILDAFIDTIWIEKGLSPNTLNSYKSDLEKYLTWIESNSLTFKNVSRSDVLEYLAHLFGQKLEGKSVARNLSSLKAFHNYLILKDITKDNPCEKIETPKFIKSIPSSLSEIQIEKFNFNTIIVEARATLDFLKEKLSLDLSKFKNEEIETLGGYIISLSGRVPIKGEVIRDVKNKIEFEIMNSDKRKIIKVKIKGLKLLNED